jgi:hypothetical protein
MDEQDSERWEIDQDDFGNPIVRHRHVTRSVNAYVTKAATGDHRARCPDCGESLDVPSEGGQRRS